MIKAIVYMGMISPSNSSLCRFQIRGGGGVRQTLESFELESVRERSLRDWTLGI